MIITVYEPDPALWDETFVGGVSHHEVYHVPLGETKAGTTTVALERGGTTIVVRSVPAAVCENCGEDCVSEREVAALMTIAEERARAGVEIEVPAFASARAAAESASLPDVRTG